MLKSRTEPDDTRCPARADNRTNPTGAAGNAAGTPPQLGKTPNEPDNRSYRAPRSVRPWRLGHERSPVSPVRGAAREGRAAMPAREALRRLPDLPRRGCSTSAAARELGLVLRRRCGPRSSPWTIISRSRPAASSRARRRLEHLIEPRCADMAAPGVPRQRRSPLVEGAVYFLGFETGSASGVRCDGGRLPGSSECSWLCANLSRGGRVLSRRLPRHGGIEGNIDRARAARLRRDRHFTLPRRAWWDEYYTPLEERMARLAPAADPALAAVIAETRGEIEVYHDGDTYGMFSTCCAWPIVTKLRPRWIGPRRRFWVWTFPSARLKSSPRSVAPVRFPGITTDEWTSRALSVPDADRCRLALVTLFTWRPGCGGHSTCSGAISGCSMSSRPWSWSGPLSLRAYGIAAVFAVVALVHGLAIKDLWWGGTASAAPGGGVPLRLVSANVLSKNRTPEKVLEFVRVADAGSGAAGGRAERRDWRQVLAALADLYPYQRRRRGATSAGDPVQPLSHHLGQGNGSAAQPAAVPAGQGCGRRPDAGDHGRSSLVAVAERARDTRRRNRELDQIAEVAPGGSPVDRGGRLQHHALVAAF